MIPGDPKTRRELIFAEGGPEGLKKSALERVKNGARRLFFQPFNEWARSLVQEIAATGLEVEPLVPVDYDGEIPGPVKRGLPEAADAVVIPLADGQGLSEELLRYLDRSDGAILAPVTDLHFSKRPVFLISIPKAGTHLLYGLVQAFGYHEGIVLTDASPRAGHWYCVEYSNSHTRARDFFVDTVRRSPFGNRNHPFMRSPAVMIYRNPLDILVSEANYYHKEGKTSFYGYLANLTFEQRLLRLIDDPWLHGSIRDRVGGFIPWLELPNVIPVSFEELVGPRGGGNAQIQSDLIWSLQLKLHVPGSPDEFSGRVFDPDSPTFFAGRVGAYCDQLTPQALEKFLRLDQDFMVALGYDGSNIDEVVSPPKRADEFRRRPLIVSGEDFEAMPIAVEHDFLGCNLVRYGDLVYAVPLVTGPVDLRTVSEEVLVSLPQATTVSELKQVLTLGPPYVALLRHWLESDLSGMITGGGGPSDSLERRPAVRLQSAHSQERQDSVLGKVGSYRGFNIVSFRWGFYGLRETLGEVDLGRGDDFLRATYRTEDLVIGDSEEAVKDRIDLIELDLHLNGQIAAVAEQIESIERQINGLSQGMAELSGRAGDMTKWITDVGNRTGEMTQWITELGNRTGGMTQQITDLGNRMGEARKWITDLGNRTGDMTQKITDLSNRTGEITKWITDLSNRTGEVTKWITDLGNLTGEMTQRITDLGNRTGEMTKWITDLGNRTGEMTQWITDLGNRTGDMTQRITDLGNRTGEMTNRIAGLDDQTEAIGQRITDLGNRTTELEKGISYRLRSLIHRILGY